MNIKITSDSTCDLSQDILEDNGITLIPLTVIKNDVEFKDNVTITPAEIFAHVASGGALCSTTAVSIGEYQDFFAPFSAQYDALRRGEVAVKGGWRLYSSGPGIYLARLIGDLLGVRIGSRGMVLDPVVPAWADGMTMTYAYRGVPVTVTYCAQAEALTVNGEVYEAAACGENRYRRTGFFLPAEVFSGEEIRIVTPMMKKG